MRREGVLGQAVLEDGNNPNKKEGFNVSQGTGDVKNPLSNGSKLSKSVAPECNSEPKFEGTTSDWLLAVGTPQEEEQTSCF